MKLFMIISILAITQAAFSQQGKVVAEKPKSKTGCIDINDEAAILKLKPKQQLALLALRKAKLQQEQAASLACYKKFETVDLSSVSSKLDVNVVFNYSPYHKFENDLHLNLDSSRNLNDFRVKLELAECLSQKFNKKSVTKEMAILPPVCSKFSFQNDKSSELRVPASAGSAVAKPKTVKTNP